MPQSSDEVSMYPERLRKNYDPQDGRMQPTIRQGSDKDVPAIERIVRAAYQHYIPRIGKPPGPMTDDYPARVASGNVWVLVLDGEIVGLVVLVPEPDHMLLENVAVAPEKQRLGLGRQLIEFAEARARQCGYREIELYTNELMHENLAWYASLGYQQTSHRLDSGFKRVFMRKTI
jgi:N-acetylglutamate synthase-like GNAT family acetyltransferase